MITAEEFFRNKIKKIFPEQTNITLSKQEITCEQAMRWTHEYSILKAKYHVEKALKYASEKVSITDWGYAVKKDSILNAYPPENIK